MAKKASPIKSNILYLINRGYSDEHVRSYLVSQGFDTYYVDKEFFAIRTRKLVTYAFSIISIIFALSFFSRFFPISGYAVAEPATQQLSSPLANQVVVYIVIIMALFVFFLIHLILNSHKR